MKLDGYFGLAPFHISNNEHCGLFLLTQFSSMCVHSSMITMKKLTRKRIVMLCLVAHSVFECVCVFRCV